MKWKKVKPKHKEGDQRVIRRFAWSPVTLDDGYVVFLETYKVLQIWKKATYPIVTGPGDVTPIGAYGWVDHHSYHISYSID